MKRKTIGLALALSLLLSGVAGPLQAYAASQDRAASTAEEFPDANFRAYLLDNYDTDKDGLLSAPEKDAITALYITSKGIRSLQGVELLPNVEYIYADLNYITDADLSQNLNLKWVQIANNMLESIQLPNQQPNSTLLYLDVFANHLTELDTSNLFALDFIHCDDNQIKQLHLSDNKLTQGHGFVAMHNQLEKIVLPNNNIEYPFQEFLAEQQENDGYKTYWYTDKEMTQEILSDTITLQGQTLYAQYGPVKYYISFDAGHEATGTMSEIKAFYDSAIALPQNQFVPISPNKVFAGWKDSKGNVYQPGQQVKNLTHRENERVQLMPVWKEMQPATTYTVYFHDQRGSAEKVETQQLRFGSASRLNTPAFAADQSQDILQGWAVQPNGLVKYAPQALVSYTSDQLPDGKLDLYAVWKKNTPPVIHASDITIQEGDPFDPLAYATATDAEDGVLVLNSDNVVKNTVDTALPGIYQVQYRVADQHGAVATLEIQVTVQAKETPNTPPVITATDKKYTVGDAFDETIALQGVTAWDAEDKDLTAHLKVQAHNVDTSKAGEYFITYTVSDTQGAAATKTIVVLVKEKNTPSPSPDVPNTGAQTQQPQSKPQTQLPQTGDKMPVQVLFVGFACAVCMVIFTVKKHSKQ